MGVTLPCMHERNLQMKQRSPKLKFAVLLLSLLLCTLLLSSCANLGGLIGTYVYEQMNEWNGEEVWQRPEETGPNTKPSTTLPSTTQPPVETPTHGQNDTPIQDHITIDGGADSIALATAKGLRSSVSVYCSFSGSTGGSFYPWGGSSSEEYYTTGSGVLYQIFADGSAFVVTNHHVVYDSESNTSNGISEDITLFLYGLEYEQYAIPATYVGGSVNYDIAILHVDQNEVLKKAIAKGSAAAVTVGNSNALIPGATTVAIGNAAGGGISATKGIVSVDSEYITMTANDHSGEVAFRVIRTDTPVNSGNSGGGLFDTKGNLIGIVNAKIISDDVENIGYAIPSVLVRAVADNIIDHCYQKDCETVMRALLGVTVTTSASTTEYDPETGVLQCFEEISVHDVTAGSLGASILQKDDIIKSITVDGKTVNITRQHHLIDAMLDARVGDAVTMIVLRDGAEQTVTTTVTSDCLAAY